MHVLIPSHQVEYLVVTYSKDDPKVLLSLRQAQILEALAANKELSTTSGDARVGINGLGKEK